MITKILISILTTAVGWPAWATCAGGLELATYRAHDPTDAAAAHARKLFPGARVIFRVAHDTRSGWRVRLTLSEAPRTWAATFDVVDNSDGTLDVRVLGGA